ncbi:cation-transporting P-type ATPase [uncultured Methanobrevibacter sp.]|uniref:cation-translocating P-type ATPase n=1 Tax=uncultured Methanobrevibacter sp. TaxID=253161 RepID=UPI002619BCB3
MEKIFEKYKTSETGLSFKEANIRLNKYGPNKLKEKKQEGPLKLFLSQFIDILIGLLIVAAIASYAIGNHLDAIVILVVVIINSIIGFIQEYRAENAMKELKSLVKTEAYVKRENEIRKIPGEELVLGDIVIIEEGFKVPADLILIESYDLHIDESSLTGESELVEKDTDYEDIENFGEKIENIEKFSKEEKIQSKIVSMNSNVITGRGIGVVMATGMDTSIGQIAEMIQDEEVETPLSIKVNKIGKTIGVLAIIVCIGVFFIDFYQDMDILEGFMTAVSLAVAAIPEGLPAVLTLTLAIGMQKMAKSKAIVKKLSSVETLGSCTVICTDKTGTLTENKMTVRESYFTNKEKSILISGLCNNSKYDNETLIGNPTDTASYLYAKQEGFIDLKERSDYEKIDEIPLDSSRKRMSIIYSKKSGQEDEYYVLTKGAPEYILSRSEFIDENGKQVPLSEDIKTNLKSKIDEMTNSSLRVISLAYKKIDSETLLKLKEIEKDKKHSNSQMKEDLLEKNLIITGLLGIMDPPREEAITAVADCQKAGIKVIMITGDHKDTAKSIAKEIGILNNENSGEDESILTGEELDNLSDEEYSQIAENISVYARVYPEQKRRIIAVLQGKGHTVSMTGDGVNDAPALKKAAIGVAMGSGTEVTKESADMIIQDDNFATIVDSIKEGRTIYDNLKRFLKFQLSTNIGAILTITIGSLMPIPTPFTPIQLLWINIIMDGPPAQSLGLEGCEDDIMERAPEKGELIDNSTMMKILLSGVVMTIGTLGLFIYELMNYNTTKAITMAFTVFVMYQLFNALNYRSNSNEVNTSLWISLIGSFILQLFVIYVPYLQIIFKTCAIGLFDWILIIVISGLILVTDKIGNKLIQ